MVPQVTIGVCVRNGANTIHNAVNSIISQDFPSDLMEVIFVDDGSQDATLSILNNFVQKMEISARVFHHEWRGLGYSRNVVVNNAKGKYIIWVDGDLIIPQGLVRKQVEYMDQHPKVAIAGGTFEMLPGESSLVAILDNAVYIIHRLKHEEGSKNLPGTGCAIYRVNALKPIGGFDENITGSGEDVDIAFRVRSNGWLVVRDKASFYGKCKKTWKALWTHYVWHGYGAHYVNHKKTSTMVLAQMTPPIMFLAGLIDIIAAYKLLNRKIAFVMPLHAVFKNVAWWFGFFKGHIKGYGHI